MIRPRAVVVGVVALGFVGVGGAAAQTVPVRVTVRNLSPANGAALSPFTFAFHDGSFDAFNSGGAASLGVRNVAELGDGTVYLQQFSSQESAGQGGMVSGSFGPGIFLPGETSSAVFNLNPATQRYLSFGAMVVPSNDRFVGNDSPTAHQLFNSGGQFVGQTITLTAANIWESGTEVDQLFGAAFIAGQNITDHVEQGSVIVPNSSFSTYLGQPTPAGYTFSAAPSAGVAEISFQVVPGPAGAAVLGIGAVLMGRPRRSRGE